MHLELLSVAEVGRGVTSAPVGLIVDLGVMEAVTRGRHPVVLWLMVLRSAEHGAGAVSATAHLH